MECGDLSPLFERPENVARGLSGDLSHLPTVVETPKKAATSRRTPRDLPLILLIAFFGVRFFVFMSGPIFGPLRDRAPAPDRQVPGNPRSARGSTPATPIGNPSRYWSDDFWSAATCRRFSSSHAFLRVAVESAIGHRFICKLSDAPTKTARRIKWNRHK